MPYLHIKCLRRLERRAGTLQHKQRKCSSTFPHHILSLLRTLKTTDLITILTFDDFPTSSRLHFLSNSTSTSSCDPPYEQPSAVWLTLFSCLCFGCESKLSMLTPSRNGLDIETQCISSATFTCGHFLPNSDNIATNSNHNIS